MPAKEELKSARWAEGIASSQGHFSPISMITTFTCYHLKTYAYVDLRSSYDTIHYFIKSIKNLRIASQYFMFEVLLPIILYNVSYHLCDWRVQHLWVLITLSPYNVLSLYFFIKITMPFSALAILYIRADNSVLSAMKLHDLLQIICKLLE